ncbi:MAG: tRNA-(ms[2]io[6]A)-hydroxylase [Pseudomonadales bacterium]|nr:tRNA-(ms[2]io[6]A)-hydroxylase [Pseudomonadales bacterium]
MSSRSNGLTEALAAVREFLACATPDAWYTEALVQKDSLLIDHANCEKKAAATAMNLMYRYTSFPLLLTKMSQLAREELLHFQQVVEILADRGVHYRRLGPSRYAAGLRKHIRKDESSALTDTLIIGAFIEARSCERFAGLIPLLEAAGDHGLAKFYGSLLKSEARHYEDYLQLAANSTDDDITERVEQFRNIEAELVSTADTTFRFHSGIPA